MQRQNNLNELDDFSIFFQQNIQKTNSDSTKQNAVITNINIYENDDLVRKKEKNVQDQKQKFMNFTPVKSDIDSFANEIFKKMNTDTINLHSQNKYHDSKQHAKNTNITTHSSVGMYLFFVKCQ